MAANVFSQRALQATARRLIAAHPSSFTRSSVFARLPAPAAVATGRNIQIRSTGTTVVSQTTGNEILASQRLHRPVSPHLTIYKFQVPWIMSALNRVTGVTLSGVLYLYGLAYLVAPTLGWHLDSASIAASFATLPFVVQAVLKTGFALPFTYHVLNGVRHLVWDTGANFTKQGVIRTGLFTAGLTALTTLGLVFFL
ncbi:hypothetical protein DV736_g1916, partial [Chaetothyriales sp. CBS 134916]